ncbi:Pol polyprotein [Gossypium australe]|uniref:Pol polyprotein n=1 Tax=Gossypium australe TaxID=47621 RepID=A0A5B6WDD3_9ROSI|nr:Pol polyprotein [Gossypium australe]
MCKSYNQEVCSRMQGSWDLVSFSFIPKWGTFWRFSHRRKGFPSWIFLADFIQGHISICKELRSMYILVAENYIPKWVEVEAYPTNDAKVVMRFLHKHIFTRFWTLRALTSNEGSHFRNKWLKSLLEKYDVKHKVATAYHLQKNGQANRANQDIKGILKKVLNLDLKQVGERRMLQIDELKELRLFSYENAKIFKGKTKRWHDKRRQPREFEVGKRVLLFNSRLKLFPGKLKS